MKISKHYTDLDVGFSTYAQRLGIENTVPAEAIKNATLVAANVLEPLREQFGHIEILSWYRSPALERELCKQDFFKWCTVNRRQFSDSYSWRDYLSTKQHPTGLAVDIRAPNSTITELYEYIRSGMTASLKIEYGHVHVAYVKKENP